MADTITVQKLWTPEQVAEFFGVPLATIYRWRSRGGGPRGFRVGKFLRYEDAEVRAFIEAQQAKEEGGR